MNHVKQTNLNNEELRDLLLTLIMELSEEEAKEVLAMWKQEQQNRTKNA